MKLATFTAGGAPELGAVVADRIVPLNRAAPGLPVDMIGLIRAWSSVEAEVRGIAGGGAGALALDGVRLLAPIPRPGKIWAIGLNYADHIAESGVETPANQVWFTKAGTAVTGPFDPVQVPTAFCDYEVEMVAVIGAGGRNIAKADAPGAVFGWCVGNDVTERMWQHRTPQWSLGKSFDTHAPFGPWITTADEIADPHALRIRLRLNGKTMQDSSTAQLVFTIPQLIASISENITLEPGDVIATGTPPGVGFARKPPVYLQPGDVCEVEIDGLGVLRNPIVAAD